MNGKNDWKDTPEQAKRRAEFLENIKKENMQWEQRINRAGWALVVLTLIVAGYFFVWAWTNF